jgi:hypothetical protein
MNHLVYGPICEKEQWRKRYSRESEDLYNETNVVNVIKSSRMSWAGHFAQMNKNGSPKKILCTNPGGQRGSKSRWIYGMKEDAWNYNVAGCFIWV